MSQQQMEYFDKNDYRMLDDVLAQVKVSRSLVAVDEVANKLRVAKALKAGVVGMGNGPGYGNLMWHSYPCGCYFL